MNELTHSTLQGSSLRVSVVSTQPRDNLAAQSGNNLPLKPSPQENTVAVASQPKVSAESVKQMRENLEAAITQMNQYTQFTQRDIQFNVDKASGRTVVSVIDRESREVIRQIPDEVFLNIARTIEESLANGVEAQVHLISAKV
jgi:flagellar protein FlaG